MRIYGGTTLRGLTPLQLEIIWHGCMAVERSALRGSNMEKVAREMHEQLRPLISSQ